MKAYHLTKTPYVARLPIRVDRTKGILTYGPDNLYPQKIELVTARSGITNTAINTLRDFVKGRGFENEALGSLVVNGKGQTMNDILGAVAEDYARFRPFGLHFNFNLVGQIAEVTPIKTKYIRYWEPTEAGEVVGVVFSRNWERDADKKRMFGDDKIIYPLFNAETAPEQIREVGIDQFPGQVFYWTPEEGTYPVTIYDSVLDSIQTDGEIQLFEISGIQNGFMAGHLVKHPGEFQSETERNQFIKNINQGVGAEANNSNILVDFPQGEIPEQPILEKFDIPNRDNMYTETRKAARDRIVQAFGGFGGLYGVRAESGMFNQEQTAQEMIAYNRKKQPDRDVISRSFESWAPFFAQPMGEDFTIKPLQDDATTGTE